jgi:hypothetical protein
MGIVGKKKQRKKLENKKKQERRENEKENYEGEKQNKPRGMGHTLHLQKVVKENGKKIKVNNPCITSQKSYERRENIQPPFHPHSPSRHKKKEKPHIRSLKYMVGQCGKCGLSTHRIPFIHINSIYAWMAIKGYTMCDEHQSTFNCVIYQFP